MGDKLRQLEEKVELARVAVPAHTRTINGHRVKVKAHLRDQRGGLKGLFDKAREALGVSADEKKVLEIVERHQMKQAKRLESEKKAARKGTPSAPDLEKVLADAVKEGKVPTGKKKGPVVNGEQFAPGYTKEAAAYEQKTRNRSQDADLPKTRDHRDKTAEHARTMIKAWGDTTLSTDADLKAYKSKGYLSKPGDLDYIDIIAKAHGGGNPEDSARELLSELRSGRVKHDNPQAVKTAMRMLEIVSKRHTGKKKRPKGEYDALAFSAETDDE